MSYEDSAGLNVNNHYGSRDSGGTQGVYKTEGYEGEFTYNLDGDNLNVLFPRNVEVIGVDETFVTGNVTALTVGGVDVIGATEAAPVGIVPANTGVLTQTGGSAGYIVVKFNGSIKGNPEPPLVRGARYLLE